MMRGARGGKAIERANKARTLHHCGALGRQSHGVCEAAGVVTAAP